MSTNRRLILILVFSALVIFQGFRYVTQSGLSGFEGTVQNDGYASIGGAMILAGGIVIGYAISRKEGNGKR